MYFRNLTVLSILPALAGDLDVPDGRAFQPCPRGVRHTSGWHPVVDDIYCLDGLMAYAVEERLVSAAAVRNEVAKAVAAAEETEGKLNRLRRREIRDAVEDRLHADAPAAKRITHLYFNGSYVVIDTASKGTVELIHRVLREDFGIRSRPISTVMSTDSATRFWMQRSTPFPAGFSLGMVLWQSSADGQVARYRHDSLDRLYDQELSIDRLGMSWTGDTDDERVSFVLDKDLCFRQVHFNGLFPDGESESPRDVVAAELALMRGEIHTMLTTLTNSMGGLVAIEEKQADE